MIFVRAAAERMQMTSINADILFFFFCRIIADILVLLSYLPSEMVYINGACDSLLSLLGLYFYCNTFPP